jgi:hypothetical protein
MGTWLEHALDWIASRTLTQIEVPADGGTGSKAVWLVASTEFGVICLEDPSGPATVVTELRRESAADLLVPFVG